MKIELTYLFDPLCGWCYGASPVINQLNKHDDISLKLLPTGLFALGHRKIDSAFASYAWANDVRIEKLTGQIFTEDYKVNVLGNLGGAFDSGSMTLALTAISLVHPELELSVVNFFQNARYGQGIDTSDCVQVCNLLKTMNLTEIADQVSRPNQALLQHNLDRLKKANKLTSMLKIQGVPALVQTINSNEKVVNSDLLYREFDELIFQLNFNMSQQKLSSR